MRKIWIIGFLIAFFGVCLPASPAPVGNLAREVFIWNQYPFRVESELDFTFERELDASGNDESVIENFNWYMTKVSYPIQDKAEIYCVFGLAHGKLDEQKSGVDVEYTLEPASIWGLGARVPVYEFENGVRVGLDARYRQASPKVDKVKINGTKYKRDDPGTSDFEFEYHEWQVAAGLSKEFMTVHGQIVPYGGVKYSDTIVRSKSIVLSTTYETDDVNSDNVFGIFVGCEFYPMDDMSFMLEGRFLDETSLTAGMSYRF